MASVSIGRRRLPPEEIKWLATSGIIVTSEPVRDRIVALTRSMSAATSATSPSIEAPDGVSKGTITATQVSAFAMFRTNNRNCGAMRQGSAGDLDVRIRADPRFAGGTTPYTRIRSTLHDRLNGEFTFARIGSHQRHRAGLGDRGLA